MPSFSEIDNLSSVNNTKELYVEVLPALSCLRRDYTTRFGNFILYYNFLKNSLKFIKVYIIRKGISQGR